QIINMKNISYRSGCPVANVLDLMGDKWSLLVIRDIFMEKNTYTVFLEGPEKISTNILSHRLKLLQELDLIGFRRDAKDKKIKYYFLTNRGIDLYPIIVEMGLWSMKHLNKSFADISYDWYEQFNTRTSAQVIEENRDNYLTIRENLLAKE
ncbi:helix-turn-helix transcriptional regulator, partial [Flavobacteriaceae bacterium]|nr:helix-turn-helix transcriptional regulator [Flavobacteriaceae bacterium]